jgi:FlaA1/EpsC-like NDP-sugar epimerase
LGEDIEVEIVGLRPGEKLYEELYDESEARHSTAHPKIMVADSSRRNLLEVIRDVNQLEEVVNESNAIVRMVLEEIVPLQSTYDVPRRWAA